MSRQLSGKSSIAAINFRLMVFFTFLFLPFGWFCRYGNQTWGQVAVIWVFWQTGAFFVAVFLARALMLIVANMMFGNNMDYLRWRHAGGDPFYDAPINFCNPDPDTVKMAIGTPPSTNRCVCGERLGKNFGNRCSLCGRYWDGY